MHRLTLASNIPSSCSCCCSQASTQQQQGPGSTHLYQAPEHELQLAAHVLRLRHPQQVLQKHRRVVVGVLC